MINVKFDANDKYYHHLRMSLLGMAHDRPQRVLEVGCAAGQSLVYFKEQGAEFVAGIELVPEVAEMARDCPQIDQVLVGNIETLDLGFEPQTFDLIIAGHVLEHTANPWAVMKKLHALLKPGGQFIGSLPNVRHVSVVLPLVLFGKWQYRDEGILDWTHLKFFSRSTIAELLESTGFRVEAIIPEIGGRKMQAINFATFGILRHFLGFTYNFSAVKAGE